ncbi:hypothetical protein [Ancylobacter defluvii]|uniref:Uncharacterized protein n=1 Tax=Ancylobacter defluvii TaxID=1282440 RepID=A0A9W6K491_9HYPH|nr:hypothetical protein [Ancylobacter defluvii]MBS7588311.1 hypothetical protein [Ancylobacter defluvii]GLK86708.1 hypothetical protein GCM10017653_47780 [Ancylobacter defluvii]
MPSEQQPAEQQPIVITDADVDEAIAACGGDARETVRTLLIAGQFMEVALEAAKQEASWGYVRGRPSRHLKEGAGS